MGEIPQKDVSTSFIANKNNSNKLYPLSYSLSRVELSLLTVVFSRGFKLINCIEVKTVLYKFKTAPPGGALLLLYNIGNIYKA